MSYGVNIQKTVGLWGQLIGKGRHAAPDGALVSVFIDLGALKTFVLQYHHHHDLHHLRRQCWILLSSLIKRLDATGVFSLIRTFFIGFNALRKLDVFFSVLDSKTHLQARYQEV